MINLFSDQITSLLSEPISNLFLMEFYFCCLPRLSGSSVLRSTHYLPGQIYWWVSPNPPFDVNDVISAHWVFYPSCNTSRKMMKLTFFFHIQIPSHCSAIFPHLEKTRCGRKRLQISQNTFKTLKKDVRMISSVEY